MTGLSTYFYLWKNAQKTLASATRLNKKVKVTMTLSDRSQKSTAITVAKTVVEFNLSNRDVITRRHPWIH
tara:strand:+ start:269 stop:478 length:210 start_codon:yes stop_codon:yes gene_type:complete